MKITPGAIVHPCRPHPFRSATGTCLERSTAAARTRPSANRADAEDRVARHSHPDQQVDDRLLHELRRARVPVALLDAPAELNHADRQQGEQRHGRQADVECPEARLQQALIPRHIRPQAAQAEQHQTDAEEPIHAEQRGVAVQRRQVQPLHVIERQRRIDQEPEQPGANHIPESDRDEEQDRPAITLHPRCRVSQLEGLIRLEADEDERHDFQRREAAPSAITAVGVPVKYRWCNVPSMPPDRKTIVANNTATVAVPMRSRPRRVNRNAITAVAKTSKNPSTHRCTTHQRQYSTIDRCVCSPHMSPAP